MTSRPPYSYYPNTGIAQHILLYDTSLDKVWLRLLAPHGSFRLPTSELRLTYPCCFGSLLPSYARYQYKPIISQTLSRPPPNPSCAPVFACLWSRKPGTLPTYRPPPPLAPTSSLSNLRQINVYAMVRPLTRLHHCFIMPTLSDSVNGSIIIDTYI